MIRRIVALLLWAVGATWAAEAFAQDRVVLVQSTTSTQNSGLYDAILPLAEAALDLDIRVVAVGSGQALQNAARCDGDLLISHARAAEEAFVAQGFGVARHDLMFNDFVVVGPETDPAGISSAADVSAAFAAIASTQVPFVSRGDDSGTHQSETALWSEIADVSAASGRWYRETGAGMGATLNIAVGMDAYTFTDRATWLAFQNRRSHRILFDGDARLHNLYGVIAVNPAHCPNVNADGAAALAGWLLSAEGQAAIAAFEIGGQQVFFPNASAP